MPDEANQSPLTTLGRLDAMSRSRPIMPMCCVDGAQVANQGRP
jgi:hypothetical protein